jgi:hypothetical protein
MHNNGIIWMLMKKNADMMKKQFLWLGARVALLNYAYFHC